MTVERRTKGGLYIPPNVSDVRTLSLRCEVCGDEFYNDEMAAFQRHVIACCRKHEDAIHAVSPRNYMSAFESDEGWDAEWARWVKENPEKWKRERDIPT